MAQAVESHKLTKVKDPKFSIDDIIHYNLSILVGKHDFQFCVFDSRSGQCLLLEDYTFDLPIGGARLGDSLYKLFESHELLMAGYWNSIKLITKNQKFTLIPSSLFSEQHLSAYLLAATDADSSQDSFYYYRHKKSDVVFAFAAEKSFTERIKSFYPTKSLQILHQGSAFIEGLQADQAPDTGQQLSLNIGRTTFSIAVTDQNKLLYFNRFVYKSPQDIVKYTMMAIQQLGLNQNTIIAKVWGIIPANSEHFVELYRYIRNISFGEKPSFLQFAFMFDELAEHQYFDLYSTYICE